MGLLQINVLGASFAIHANEKDEYLQKLLDYYKKIISETKKNLEESIPKINTAFETCDFSCLLTELADYDKNVKKHYKEYLRTTEVWDDLKMKIREEVK